MNNYKVISWDIGTCNLAYCCIEYNNGINSIIEWNVINLKENQKTISHENVYLQLYDISNIFEYNYVLIESQMNATMKPIQTLIEGFFMYDKLFNPYTNIKQIINCSATFKLKPYTLELKKMNDTIDSTFSIEKIKRKEKDNRKKLAEIITYTEIEKNYNDKLQLFTSHKKKDDLSDCFLQALYYINNVFNVIPKQKRKYNKK